MTDSTCCKILCISVLRRYKLKCFWMRVQVVVINGHYTVINEQYVSKNRNCRRNTNFHSIYANKWDALSYHTKLALSLISTLTIYTYYYIFLLLFCLYVLKQLHMLHLEWLPKIKEIRARLSPGFYLLFFLKLFPISYVY